MGKKKKNQELEKANEFEQLVSMDSAPVTEEPTEGKKKKKNKKEVEIQETNSIDMTNTEATSEPNKDINEDLYAPFGDKTFNPNDVNSGGEDLYAPFGDKTFSKDALLDSNTSNDNASKLNEDLTIAMEDVKPKDQEIEKLRSDNEYLNNVDEDVIKEHIKKKKTPEEQNVFDLDMIKNYMGKGYELFTKNKFNMNACLFGGLYLVYRKIYLGLLLFMIAAALITFFIPNLIIVGAVALVVIVLHIIIGKNFNKKYLERSYKKIKEIETRYNANQDDFILSKSKELGGTNIAGTIILTILLGAAIIGGILFIK